MDRNTLGHRLDEFQKLGVRCRFAEDVIASIPGGIECSTRFRAGRLDIVPPVPDLDEPFVGDHRIIFTSWNGLRLEDITDITNELFIEFMEAIDENTKATLRAANTRPPS